jgi:uncharacterized membrane protein
VGKGRPVPGPGRHVAAARPGYLVGLDVPALVAEAVRCDVQLVVTVPLGAFLAEGMPILSVHGESPGRVHEDRLRRALPLGRKRTMAQDVAFGFRQLVDIADKALSPGVNDPTTAVQALDALHDLLRRLAARGDPARDHLDDTGTLRVRTRERGFTGHLDLALDEVVQYGGDSDQVVARVRWLLEDLLTAATAEHLPAVQAKLAAMPSAQVDQADR